MQNTFRRDDRFSTRAQTREKMHPPINLRSVKFGSACVSLIDRHQTAINGRLSKQMVIDPADRKLSPP